MSEPPVAPAPAVTLQELASWMAMSTPPSGQTQTDLQSALDAALGYVENRVGAIAQASREYKVYPQGALLVLPIVRVEAVTTVVDPDGVEVTPTATNLLSGIVTLPVVPTDGRRWTVTATSEATRAELLEAVKIIASHLYEVHRGRGAIPNNGGYPTTDDGRATLPAGFAIPARAQQLIVGREVPL